MRATKIGVGAKIGVRRLLIGSLALVVASVSGCSTFDVDRTISLVLSEEFGSVEAYELELAANRWNRHFGTDLRMTEFGESQQEVSIYYNDLVCAYASGRTEVTLPVEIHVCRHHLVYENSMGEVRLNNQNVFFLFLHELGHVLNIRVHADDPRAVMHMSASYDMSIGARFTEEDEQLFNEANPDRD